MKTYVLDYYKDCQLANDIESAVNTSGCVKLQLANIEKLTDGKTLHDFMVACILYWSKTKMFDERNRRAVLSSRIIAKKYFATEASTDDINEETMKQAYGFTQYAHRYLQGTFFNVILEYFRREGTLGIYEWYTEQDFVYDNRKDTLVPRKNWNPFF